MRRVKKVEWLIFVFAILGFVGTHYALGEPAWEPSIPLGTARAEPGVTVGVDGAIYAIGGEGTNPKHSLGTAERWYEGQAAWQPIEPMSVERHLVGVVTDSFGHIWATGGFSHTAGSVWDTVEIYDPASDTWQSGPPMNEERVSHGVATDSDGCIYVFGGHGTSVAPHPWATSSVEMYNPNTGQWSYIASLNKARLNPGYTHDLQGRIYAIGGSNDEEGWRELDTVERYDPAHPEDGWQYVANMPRHLGGSAAFLYEGEIWIVGGGETPQYWTNGCYIYTPDPDPKPTDPWPANSWRTGPTIYEILNHAGAVVGTSGTPYVIGGERGGGSVASDHVTMLAPEPPECWQEQEKLLASDGTSGDLFGSSVAVSGDYMIVGAYKADGHELNTGSAYIFKYDGANWVQQCKLIASDGANNDYFGYAVCINENYAIVGSQHDDSKAGSAYVFKQSDIPGDLNWYQQAKLTASDRAAYDYFGREVSLDGEYAIVDAHENDDKGGNSGSAYIFKRDESSGNWLEHVKLLSSDGAAGDLFGFTVAINGDYAIVGAYKDDDKGGSSGSAYIFYRNEGGPDNWGQQAKLLAPDGVAGNYFGYSVSISGDYVIVGSYYGNGNENNSGAADIFYRNEDGPNNWGHQAKLQAPDGATNDTFGESVSISGENAIVGATYDDNYVGSAYIFKRDETNWTEVKKLTASDAAVMDLFGISVFINAGYVTVGAVGNDDNGDTSGSAYVFENICNTTPITDAGGPYVAQATSWLGTFVDLDGSGSSDPDGDAITYGWDLDLSDDSDGDGDPTNDTDSIESNPNWLFPIGQTEISLVVVDEQGARSEPDVTTVTVSIIEVGIDIKPGSFPNSINMGSNGVIPVAFLTDSGFDASSIDPTTVTLRGEDFTDGLVKLRGKKDAPVPMSNLEDVDEDGDLDLVVHLVTEKLAEYELDAICELGALTYEGYVISGSDTIRIVPE